MKWLSFLRHYGPIPRNDNMYDETIQRSARRSGIAPVEFEHPMQQRILECFHTGTTRPASLILTGTAGDGKTHLCRHVWDALGGAQGEWSSDSPYLMLERHKSDDAQTTKFHFIRDLSGWAPQQGAEWEHEKEDLLQQFCDSLFGNNSSDVFLIAANDGQLIESWRRLKETESVLKARQVFEDLLVEDRQEQSGVRLKFFNLSRTGSAQLLDRALDAFLNHSGWQEFKEGVRGENEVFGLNCPIRRNYELLQTPLVRSRLRSLLELCDYNGLHLPIRQILLLLTNALLGHPDVKDHLMSENDVPKVIAAGTVSKASLYNNIFGGNLSENRRQSITIFEYLERFQIGYETSNRVDNILIFGEDDEHLGHYFDEFVAKDRFYGADARFYAAKQDYIEGTDESEDRPEAFLQLLISQRRGLFFKIPKEAESELALWELTVFKFAGEYLDDVVGVVKAQQVVKRPILSRLVKGLNRVFTGMLINSDRELYLAMSGNYSQAKVSRILIERVSVDPSKGEKVTVAYNAANDQVLLSVFFTPQLRVDFNLTLVRYEFLSRIALEGALPASFSKECYEDLLAFKSKLIAAHAAREETERRPNQSAIGLSLLALTDEGMPDPKFVEIAP
jgi:hypothetical protein